MSKAPRTEKYEHNQWEDTKTKTKPAADVDDGRQVGLDPQCSTRSSQEQAELIKELIKK